jgi:hypothetical protein
LGHAKPSITLDIYGHLIPGMQEEAAQMIDKLIPAVVIQQLHPIAPDLHPILPVESPDFYILAGVSKNIHRYGPK